MNRTLKKAVWVLAVFALLGAVALAGAEKSTKKDGQVTREYAVIGMTCGGCAAAVKMTLKRLEGVSAAKVSYEDGNAVVTFDPGRTGDEKIIQAVEKLGYKAKLQKNPKKNPKKDSDA